MHRRPSKIYLGQQGLAEPYLSSADIEASAIDLQQLEAKASYRRGEFIRINDLRPASGGYRTVHNIRSKAGMLGHINVAMSTHRDGICLTQLPSF